MVKAGVLSIVLLTAVGFDLSADLLGGEAAFLAAATWLGGTADLGGFLVGDEEGAEAFPAGVFVLALRAILIAIQEQVAGFGDQMGDGSAKAGFEAGAEAGDGEIDAEDAARGAFVDVLSARAAAGGEAHLDGVARHDDAGREHDAAERGW